MLTYAFFASNSKESQEDFALDEGASDGEGWSHIEECIDGDDDKDYDSDGVLQVSVSKEELRQGNFSLVYAHPESFLTSTEGKALVRSPLFRKHVCCVAVDEAHMIHEW